MKVNALDESAVSDIGHAFGYYDYGGERGLIDAFASRDVAAAYICGYVRMALKSGMLYTTGERGEGYIAYKRPGEKIGLKAGMFWARGWLGSMNFRELVRFFGVMTKGGQGLRSRMDREKKPYVYVGLVCVREPYQGQGYMRKVMEMAFAEGDRLQIPVILDTDAKSKRDKYVHLGMEPDGERSFGGFGTLYDLIRYPKARSAPEND